MLNKLLTAKLTRRDPDAYRRCLTVEFQRLDPDAEKVSYRRVPEA
jgi:hypothetical protein